MLRASEQNVFIPIVTNNNNTFIEKMYQQIYCIVHLTFLNSIFVILFGTDPFITNSSDASVIPERAH